MEILAIIGGLFIVVGLLILLFWLFTDTGMGSPIQWMFFMGWSLLNVHPVLGAFVLISIGVLLGIVLV